MKNRKITYLSIFIIFLIGLALRMYRLGLNQPPLYADETGGHYLYFNYVRSGFQNPFVWTFDVIFSASWMFGLNPIGVRFFSALYGSLIGICIFFLAYSITRKDFWTSFISGLLTTIIPWSFMVSRIGHTHIPIIVILSLIHVIILINAKNFKSYFLSLIPLAIASLIYSSILIISIFEFVLVLYFAYKSINKSREKVFFTIGTSIIFLTAFLFGSNRFQIFNPQGRGLDLAIWNDVNTPYEIDKYRAVTWNSQPTIFSFNLPAEQLANKLVFNKIIANLTVFSRNYFSFFSPDWLFLRGDPVLRHSTGMVGELYPFLIPFLFYGAYIFFKENTLKNKIILTFWILISPVPAAITKDGYGYLLRAITLLPFLTYLSALGLTRVLFVFNSFWKVLLAISVFLIGIYSSYYFLYGYFHVYPYISARSYEYGFKELSDFQVSHNQESMLIIWNGYYHDHDFRFWQNTPIDQFKAFKLNKIEIGSSEFWQTYPNLFFANPKNVSDLRSFIATYHPVFVVLPDKYFVIYPDSFVSILGTKAETIYYPDMTPSLNIFYSQKQLNFFRK